MVFETVFIVLQNSKKLKNTLRTDFDSLIFAEIGTMESDFAEI